jgi:hypothetical protein
MDDSHLFLLQLLGRRGEESSFSKNMLWMLSSCMSNTIMQTLREAGHEVVRLQEQLPVESIDADTIAKAK